MFVIKTTELMVYCLPFLIAFAVVVLIAATIRYLLRVRFVNRQWLTICMRVAGSILLLPLILALLLLILMVGCSSRPRIAVSPDSQHVAAYSYEAGFLGRDLTFVTVRRRWSIRPDVAYQYAGPSDWTATEVRWLDNQRLMIRYHPDREGRFQECRTEAGGITVQCREATTPTPRSAADHK